MNFFRRLKTLWTGFWSNFIGEAESRNQHLVNEGLMQNQRKQLQRLKQAITQLIYQRKRIEHKLKSISETEEQLNADIEQAAMKDRDEIALRLMEKLEYVEEERTFLSEQLTTLNIDIEAAKKSEVQLTSELNKSRQTLTHLTNRKDALVARNKIRQQIKGASTTNGIDQNVFDTIQDQIHKLEAENEMLTKSEANLDSQIAEFREKRKLSDREVSLQQLKMTLNKRLLPEPQKVMQTV